MLATYLNQANAIAIVPVSILANLNQITASDGTSISFGSSFFAAYSLTAFGSGITTDAGGAITGGTIDRIEFYENGFLQLRLENFTPFAATLAASAFTGGSLPGYDLLIDLHAGTSLVTGSTANDWIDTGSGNDQVTSGDGNDRVSKFMAGNLNYDGGLGSDTLNLGAENGFIYPTPFVQQFIVDLGAGTAQSPYGGTFTLRSVENVIGTSQSDRITGSDADNVIGDGGFDRGADVIDARGGNDTVKMNIQESGVVADGGSGSDTIFIDTAGPLAGWNVLDLENAAANTGVFARNAFVNFENVFLWQNEPLILLDFRGNELANTATGGSGNDRLSGRGGGDVLDGGDGSDYVSYYHDGAVRTSLDGSVTNTGAAAGDTYFSIENLSGSNTGNDILIGNAAVNKLVGNGGADNLRGGAGGDALYGGSGNDFASYFFDAAVTTSLDGTQAQTGAAAGDTYSSIENLSGSNTGGDELTGNGLANKLYGNGGADILRGQAGDDTLRGGADADILSGGTGADTFQYLSAGDGGDTITAFSSIDIFAFKGSAFGGLAIGTLDPARFTARAADNFAQDAADRFIFRQSDDTLWYDPDGGDATPGGAANAILIADITANATVGPADIVVF